jgi:hypothetical protein
MKASTRLWINPRKQELIRMHRYNTAIRSLKFHSNHNKALFIPSSSPWFISCSALQVLHGYASHMRHFMNVSQRAQRLCISKVFNSIDALANDLQFNRTLSKNFFFL